MIKLINLLEAKAHKDRLVYAWEFPNENYAYIGLTGDEEARRRAHQSRTAKKTTAVSRYIRRNGIEPSDESYKVLSRSEANPSGMIPEAEAQALECNSIGDYERAGWKLLNLAPCGGLGGSVYDEEEVLRSMDNFINSTDTSLDAVKLLSGSKYLINAIEQENRRNEVFKRIESIVKDNNIKSTSQLKGETNRRLSKLIEDWSKKHREDDNWQAKLFPENIHKVTKAKGSVDAFLAEPNNLDINQLRLVTPTALKHNPEREDEFKAKLEKIIKASGIQSNNELKKGPYRAAGELIQKEKWTKELFPDNKSGPKRKASITESTDDKEVLRRTIQGFELIPAKYGFGHPYVTKNGKATSDLATRINTWIQGEFNGSSIKVKYDPVYKALNFFKS